MSMQKRLISRIEEKREQLIKVGIKYGLTSAIAIHYSEELDQLINEYQQLFLSNKPLMNQNAPIFNKDV